MVDLLSIFDQPAATFMFLKEGTKKPPLERGWQRKPHNFQEAVAHDGNVGIIAGNGYIGFDQDVPTAFQGLELPETTTWETRPGRLGLWFKCNDRTPELLARYGKKADAAQTYLYKDGAQVGEIKLERSYQVIPPSWKILDDGVTRADYKLLQEVPPAEISLEWLMAELQLIGITFSSTLESNAAKLENTGRQSRKRRAATDEQKDRAWAEAALEKEVEKVRTARKGDRNHQLNDSAFALGQIVGAGLLSESEVIRALESVAEDDEPEKIPATIRSGIESGRRSPRGPKDQEPKNNMATVATLNQSDDIKRIAESIMKHFSPQHFKQFALGGVYTPGEVSVEEIEALLRTGKSLQELEFGDMFDSTDKNDSDGNPIYKFNYSKTVNAILKKLPIVLGEDGLLYYWIGATWTAKAEDILYAKIHNLAGKHYNRYNQKEVITALYHLLAFRRVKINPDPWLLGVSNGVIDLRTKEFRPYKKEDYISSSIETAYNHTARCPRFEKFLEEVCPNEIDRKMLVDWLALHAIGKAFPYVMFLVGRGRNGKGVYEAVLQALYSNASFSFMSLEEINRSNFAKGNLIGKRGLIVSEIGDDTKKGKGRIPTRFLKLASGDGFIDSDRKNAGRILFPPSFKATIDTNDMPDIPDTSKGWEERFCKADMPWLFVDSPDPNNPREKLKDPHLKAKLTTPEELSGLLNLIIDRAFQIAKTEKIIKRSGADYMAEYKVQSSSARAFLEKYCEYVPYCKGAPVQAAWWLDEIYKAYVEWVTQATVNGDKQDETRFGGQVRKFCAKIDATKVRDGDRTRRKYPGLMFFKEKYDKDMKSLSAPLVPLGSTTVPLESIVVPLVPLKDTISMSIRKEEGIIH